MGSDVVGPTLRDAILNSEIPDEWEWERGAGILKWAAGLDLTAAPLNETKNGGCDHSLAAKLEI